MMNNLQCPLCNYTDNIDIPSEQYITQNCPKCELQCNHWIRIDSKGNISYSSANYEKSYTQSTDVHNEGQLVKMKRI